MNPLLRTKSIDQIMSEPAEEGSGLKRVLGAKDLVSLGIGAIIGAGIFATTGEAAAGSEHHLAAGPAVVLSYVVVAIACGFCALCYAEFASMIPIAGSAYTYAYATLGELAAWIIGWDLILEYAVGNVAVAVSWSGYLSTFFKMLGHELSPAWTTASMDAAKSGLGFAFNLPAFLIVLAITALLVRGVRESVTFNNIVVAIKLVVLALFIGVGAGFVDTANWAPFAPNGWAGIHGAAAVIFFAYIGFDAVSTAAEETKDPAKNLPIGMIGSLVICTLLYVLVSGIMTGLTSYTHLGTADPMSTALTELAKRPGLTVSNLKVIGAANWLVTVGALFSLTAVLLVFQMGQPRIFFSIARDGLLPRWFARVHPRFQTPYVTTIVTGVLVAVSAAMFDMSLVIQLCNIGTLFAFVIVCAAVLLKRARDAADQPGPPAYRGGATATLLLIPALLLWAVLSPSLADRLTVLCSVPLCLWTGLVYLKLPRATGRPFTTPLAPLTPVLGCITCLWLMMGSPFMTWVRFFVWLAIGGVIYLVYGRHHSALNELPLESNDIDDDHRFGLTPRV